MQYTDRSITTAEVLRNLGLRFRDYRMQLKKTRKEISEASGLGMTTIYKFETGKMTDLSLSSLIRLLRSIDQLGNWENILPELPENPYLYHDNLKKKQRVRHSSKK